MIGPVEPLGGITAASEEVRLPGAIGGDARNFVDLGLIGYRIGRIRGRGGDQEIDLLAKNEFGSDLGCAARVRLTVLADDLHRIGLAAAADAACHDLAHLIDNESVGFTEACERAGA